MVNIIVHHIWEDVFSPLCLSEISTVDVRGKSNRKHRFLWRGTFRGGGEEPSPGNFGGLAQHWSYFGWKVIFKHFLAEGFKTIGILLGASWKYCFVFSVWLFELRESTWFECRMQGIVKQASVKWWIGGWEIPYLSNIRKRELQWLPTLTCEAWSSAFGIKFSVVRATSPEPRKEGEGPRIWVLPVSSAPSFCDVLKCYGFC